MFPSLKFGAYTVYLLGVCTTKPWPTQSTGTDNSILPLELTVGVEASKLRAKTRFDTSTIQTLEWKSKTKFNKEPTDICKFYVYIYIYIYLYIYKFTWINMASFWVVLKKKKKKGVVSLIFF